MKKKTGIKKIPIKDYDAFVDIVTNAYPGFHQSRGLDKRRLKESILRLNRRIFRESVSCTVSLIYHKFLIF